jgi:subtilisin family serine protease
MTFFAAGMTFFAAGITFFAALSPTLALANSKPIVVAIFEDPGVDIEHPALIDHLWHNPNEISPEMTGPKDNDRNGIENDVHGVNWAETNGNLYDDNGHGTHVAGMVLGVHTNRPVQNIQIMSFKNDRVDPGLSLLKSLEYAASQGIKIFNISYEFSKKLMTKDKETMLPWIKAFYQKRNQPIVSQNDEDYAYWLEQYEFDFMASWQTAMDKIKELENKMLIVASVGNSSRNLNREDIEPATVAAKNIISVMNLNNHFQPAALTDFGSQRVLLGAIGTNIVSSVPNYVRSSGKMPLSGASQAAAHISHHCARIALALQNKGVVLSPTNIKAALLAKLKQSEALKEYTINGNYLPK